LIQNQLQLNYIIDIMKKELKNQIVAELSNQIANSNCMYITDISTLDVKTTVNLRKSCFNKNVKLIVVKNTLLKMAMQNSGKNFDELYSVLEGPSSIMFSDAGNLPAKIISDFRKNFKNTHPILKGAYVNESCFIGNEQLETLVNLKSKNELIGDIIGLLQSPIRNVVSALQSGGSKISGILKTMSEKTE